jgi:hypothetical protein
MTDADGKVERVPGHAIDRIKDKLNRRDRS